MVVDDSAVIRGLLTRSLESDPSIAVVASVPNGEVALKTLSREDIDVIILDIEMPVMDGLTALPRLIELKPGTRVIMASTLTRKNAEISLRAMEAGAADYVTKPSSTGALNSAGEFRRELTEKIKALCSGKRGGEACGPGPARTAGSARTPAAPVLDVAVRDIKLRSAPVLPPEAIAIASSTGGPPALHEFFGNLPGDIKQPILITQHMPATFTTLLAEHIGRTAKMPSREGKDGETVVGGTIYVAPGGYHMEVVRDGDRNVIRLTEEPPENYCRPAADPMFRSLSKIYGPRLLAVVFTGMGSDGRRGAEIITAAGGTVIAQDEESSVVWGMPGAVAMAGVCSAVLPLADIAPYVRKLMMRSAA
jgi:two-component system chemotaxis response regulator CheB